MATIPDSARELIESGALAHLATIDADGAAQMSCVWIGVAGDDVVFASLGARRKLANITRDPRVTLSLQSAHANPMGLQEYLVLRGRASVQEGGGPELLQRLAHVYIGPGVKFPAMDDPPPGYVVRIAVEHVGGVGPWA